MEVGTSWRDARGRAGRCSVPGSAACVRRRVVADADAVEDSRFRATWSWSPEADDFVAVILGATTSAGAQSAAGSSNALNRRSWKRADSAESAEEPMSVVDSVQERYGGSGLLSGAESFGRVLRLAAEHSPPSRLRVPAMA